MILRRRSLYSKEIREKEMNFSLDEYQALCQGQKNWTDFVNEHDLGQEDYFFLKYGCIEEEIKPMQELLEKAMKDQTRIVGYV